MLDSVTLALGVMFWPLLESILFTLTQSGIESGWSRQFCCERCVENPWEAGRCVHVRLGSGGQGVRFVASGVAAAGLELHGRHVKQKAVCERERLESPSEREQIRDAILHRHAT